MQYELLFSVRSVVYFCRDDENKRARNSLAAPCMLRPPVSYATES